MSIQNKKLAKVISAAVAGLIVCLGLVSGASIVRAQASIDVLIYDGPASSGNLLTTVTANQPRPDVNQAMNVSGDHGFTWMVPASLYDGQAHSLYVYGVNNNSQFPNTLLTNSPMTIRCQLPPPPPGTVPTIFMETSPTNVSWWLGGSIDILWSVTGADSCTASGNWSGAKPLNSSENIYIAPFSSSQTYTLTCSNSNGSSSSSVTVTVGAASAQCANGLDDDGDGKVDMADPGCTSASDTDETDPVVPPSSDMCPNISGIQASVPNGYTTNASGDCVPVGPDWCPNIPGTQTSVPANYTVDAAGDCVPVDPDWCPNIVGTQTSVPTGYTLDASGDCVPVGPDWCPNIPGTQTSVPAGMTVDTQGDCIPIALSQCSNGLDDDSDGKVDMADPDCTSASDNNESSIPQCSNNIDDDGDGKKDFPADPGCVNANDDTENTDNGGCLINCGSGGDGVGGGNGGSGGSGGNSGNVSGFTVSGTQKIAIQFLAGLSATSQPAAISINPVSNFSAPVTLSVESIRSASGASLPSDVTPTFYFGGQQASSALMSYSPTHGQYINTNGLIGTTFAINLSKKITEKYYITIVGVSGVGRAVYVIELNPNNLNPDFREI